MTLTEKGISTTRTPGQFACEEYYSKLSGGHRVQWDYRDSKGELHSGIAKTVEQAKEAARRSSGETIQ